MKQKKDQDAFAPKMSLKERVQKSVSAKGFRLGGYSAVSIVIVLIVAVIINLAFGKLPSSATKLDLTADKLSSISEQTKTLVSALEQEVTVYWIVQDGSEDATIEQLLNRYTDLSSKCKVVKKDPVVNPNFASQYTSDQVYNNSLIVVCGERSQYISYYDIYVTDYSNYNTTGETSTEFYGESCITSAVDYVTSADLPTMYVLDGHGDSGLDASLSNMIAKQNITVTSLNLLTESAVPSDCDVLMIYAPQTDLSKDEAKMITDYLASGGKMMLITGYTDQAMPNLDSVMAAYGTARKDGMVFDGNKSNYYQYPYLLLPNIGDHDITAPFASGYYVLYPEAQAIEKTGNAPETVTVTDLLTTSDAAYIKQNVTNLNTLEKEGEDEEGEYTTAVAIADSDSNAQIVWFTSTLFTQSSYDEAVGGTNTDLFLNALSWMCKSESNITIHAKTISQQYLTVSASTRAILMLIMLVVLPLAFLAVGIYVAVSRRKR